MIIPDFIRRIATWCYNIYRTVVDYFFPPEVVNNPVSARFSDQEDVLRPLLQKNSVPPLQSTNSLREKALQNSEEGYQATLELLKNPQMISLQTSADIVAILLLHREQLIAEGGSKEVIRKKFNDLLPGNEDLLFKLACENSKFAIQLLKSRYVLLFTPIELIKIAHQHRHANDYKSALLDRKPADRRPIPSILSILIIAKNYSKEMYREVKNVIKSSVTLLFILNVEIIKAKSADNEPRALRQNARFEEAKLDQNQQAINPYEILAVSRNASSQEIKVAFRKKALVLYPDKIHTVNGDRMKALNAAYEILSDPAKRSAWDKAHTESHDNPPLRPRI